LSSHPIAHPGIAHPALPPPSAERSLFGETEDMPWARGSFGGVVCSAVLWCLFKSGPS
jgi:hypothetical protein